PTLTIGAIRAMTGCINLANNPLAYQVPIPSLNRLAIDCFDYPYKLMTQHARKIHVATDNLQVGVANACQQDTDKGFTTNRSWHGIVLLKCKVSFPVN